MSAQNNEVNRVVDDTAEGHVRFLVEESDDAGKKVAKKAAGRARAIDDAETEGHKVLRAQEAEELRTRAIRSASIDDAEAEGHIVRR